MASLIYLDTHVVAWLFTGRLDSLPRKARRLLDVNELAISPIVRLELQLLYEVGRVAHSGGTVVEDLQRQLGLQICGLPFDHVTAVAEQQTWTRDPFDRLVVGQASVAGRPLVTKDGSIHDNYPAAVWD
jgi:PIN domain nuclease of toxin-antitoxin system